MIKDFFAGITSYFLREIIDGRKMFDYGFKIQDYGLPTISFKLEGKIHNHKSLIHNQLKPFSAYAYEWF